MGPERQYRVMVHLTQQPRSAVMVEISLLRERGRDLGKFLVDVRKRTCILESNDGRVGD
jgi:hypothetical protein